MSEETAAERIARKREQAELLRGQIALLEIAQRDALAEREREIEEAALDAELARLQGEKANAVQAVGGSVAEALAAMEQWAETPQRLPLGTTSEAAVEASTGVPVVARPALGETNTEGEGK